MQYLLPAIVHINHQPYLERGDGPIVSADLQGSIYQDKVPQSEQTLSYPSLVSGAGSDQGACSAGPTGGI